MQGLTRLLKLKIAVTAIFWCIPLLLFPAAWFIQLGVPSPEPMFFARLLGAAYLALLVGYYEGLRGIQRGGNPIAVIHTGIASNVGAGLLMAYFGLSGAWNAWSQGAIIFMWISTLGAFYVAAKLVYFRSQASRI